MSTDLIIQHIQSGAQALPLPPVMSDAAIAGAHKMIEMVDLNINWLRGDLYAHVAKLRPTKRAADSTQLSFDLPVEQNERVAMMMDNSCQPRSVGRLACRVASVLPPELRKPGVSWEMHAVILEESGVFEKEGGGALELALGFLDHVVSERELGEDLTPSDIRKMIRTTRAIDANDGPTPPAAGGSTVGSVMREVQTLNIEVRKIDPKKLSSHDREALAAQMRELITFYELINTSA